MRVVILGCGPAGLFAAHAAVLAGHEIEIYSRCRKSEMFGAQYLHEAIPGLSEGSGFLLEYFLEGSPEGYAQKVYGDVPPDFVSPEKLVGVHQVWDIRAAYDRSWVLYGEKVVNVDRITARDLVEATRPGGFLAGARVISTIPARSICRRPAFHTFAVREAWAVGDAPERGVACPITVAEDTVVCDGTPDTGWYRASNIRGFRTAEWPEERRPPVTDIAKISKVVRTNCDCWKAEGFWRTGRYGTWDKRVLTHHAFWEILGAFRSEEGRHPGDG